MKPSKKKSKKKRKPSSESPPQGSRLGGGEISQAKEEEKEGGGGGGVEEEKRTLDWLIDAFSSASLDEVNSAYRDADGDAYKAAVILEAGSVELQRNDSLSGSHALCKKKGFGSRTQKRVAASTGMVSGVIGKDYAKSAQTVGRRNGGSPTMEATKKQPYSNEEAEEFLFSMLGDSCEFGMDIVRDVFGHCVFDVEKTLDALLDISASSSNQFEDMGFGNYRKSNLTDRTSASAYHPYENKHEFQQSIGYRGYTEVLVGSEEQPSFMSGTVKPSLQQLVLESLFNIPDNSKYVPSCMNWKNVVKKVESFGQGLEFRVASMAEPLQNTINGKDYQEFRSAARKNWETMKAYYQKAAMAYSKGERAHASYLSEQGKSYSKLAREADEKASREIFEARNKEIKNAVTIDLHGQHVKQAIGLLKLHLLVFTYIPSIQFLKVITGCGADGVGKGKLKRSVIGLVEKEGIEWSEENVGTLVLRVDGVKEYSFVKCESDSE